MTPAFQIRPIDSASEREALEVYRQCEDFLALGPVATASLEMVRADMDHSRAQGGIFCGIFNEAGQMMGILDYLPRGFEGDPHAAFLELLMIGTPFRGLGLGAAVFAWLEEQVRQDPDVKVLRSGVQVNNPGAIRFWQRCGFKITSGPTPMPDQTTVYGLEKWLGEEISPQRTQRAGRREKRERIEGIESRRRDASAKLGYLYPQLYLACNRRGEANGDWFAIRRQICFRWLRPSWKIVYIFWLSFFSLIQTFVPSVISVVKSSFETDR